MKGKPNWEHLNDELHVLITVEDTKNRAEVKLRRAVEEIKRLLVPAVSSFILHIAEKINKEFLIFVCS